MDLGAYDLTRSGPYDVGQGSLGRVVVYEPRNRPAGCRMPIAHFSNGTGARCMFYASFSRHLASYGYLVTCYESSQTGSGDPCMRAISAAMDEFGDEVYADRFLSTGHSQGGGASHTCQFLLEREYPAANVASAGIQPAHGMSRAGYAGEYPRIRGPVFMFSGSRDGVVPANWVGRGYALIESEKYWYEAVGASHFNPHAWANTSVLSFGQWTLFGDERAGEYFRALPDENEWQAR